MRPCRTDNMEIDTHSFEVLKETRTGFGMVLRMTDINGEL